MNYHFQDRTLYRGFRTYGGGKTKITLSSGRTVAGTWITGQVQKLTPVPVGGKVMPSYVCLTPKGWATKLTRDMILPETLGIFSGEMILTDWERLPKGEQTKWLKNNSSRDWNGIPVFEGDLFHCQRGSRKTVLVVASEKSGHCYLEDLETGERCDNCDYSQFAPCGNLWQPPKGVVKEMIFRYTENRDKGERKNEEAV